MNKYSNFLTVILVLIIIAIVGIIGFLGFKFYETTTNTNNSEEFVDAFGNQSQKYPNKNNNTNNKPSDEEEEDSADDEFVSVEGNENNESSSSSGGSSGGKKYNGYLVSGTIEIPATNLKYPILAASEYSPKALDTSVVELYGVGLNKVGNTTISGHNYRNGTFFSNNKKLSVGDKIYITDLSGKRLSYTIYDKFETTENDAEYMSRDTKGAIEISLSTCTDNGKARLIILAKANV